jgi:hypothetical protein
MNQPKQCAFKAAPLFILLTALAAFLTACDWNRSASESKPPIVTGDIKRGIETHIDKEVERGSGFFVVPFEDKELKLKLVRVHVEYLASLGPNRHFACVDMASDDGQFYDIDFWMDGKPGSMSVTETTVHKLNGVPYYVWKQNEDKKWVRAPVSDADEQLLGVISGWDKFEFRYQASLPEITGPAECWLPLAQSDDFQKLNVVSMNLPGKHRILDETRHGNKVIHLKLGPEDSGKPIEVVYDVMRHEKGAYPGDPEEAKEHLKPERMVPSNPEIKAIAEEAIAGKQGELERARALYDRVLDMMSYKKFGPGWGQGDSVFACSAKYGNCTDYHSLFIGLARSVGIPARFAIGASIPSQRNDGGTDGYHCWAEFYADGKWWPVDISEGDKFSGLSMYFFGHHPANRIEFTKGRDLEVNPEPASGPINFLAYPLLEIDKQPVKVDKLFLFKRTSCAAQSS